MVVVVVVMVMVTNEGNSDEEGKPTRMLITQIISIVVFRNNPYNALHLKTVYQNTHADMLAQ